MKKFIVNLLSMIIVFSVLAAMAYVPYWIGLNVDSLNLPLWSFIKTWSYGIVFIISMGFTAVFAVGFLYKLYLEFFN